MADAHNIAWAAGLFEGEGCITTSENKGRPRVQLVLGSTDRDVVERFAVIARCGRINPRLTKSARHRTLWVWCSQGRSAEEFMVSLLPWLGERRADKMYEALALLELIGTPNGEKTHCAKGHPYDSENTRRKADGSRHCRACVRASNQARKERALAGQS